MDYEIIKADYQNNLHADSIVKLLDEYASNKVGGGKPLSQFTKKNLVKSLNDLPNAFSLLAISKKTAIGLVNCFYNFSTFKCKKIINIHDLIVSEKFRKMGIAQKLLDAVTKKALEEKCCKITLEVLSENIPAKNLYIKAGFKSYQLDPAKGYALFWEKSI